MIVDQKRKVIYLHNPKSGGSFLRDSYIEKYGETDATKWWKLFSEEHGTDLGHISYDDLSRFIPGWENYRLIVMVRNPYNRFYSAVKELRKQKSPSIKASFIQNRHPGYLLRDEDEEWSLAKKIYEFFRLICPGTYTHRLWKLLRVSTDEFCKQVFRFKSGGQDSFLRNKRIPWLNPQSDFMGEKVEVLRYESLSDWEILLEAFGLPEYRGKLKVAKEYDIPGPVCEMIRKLYPEDSLLFDLYKNIANDNENNPCN